MAGFGMWTFTTIQFVVVTLTAGLVQGVCRDKSPCSCTMDNGKVVDLSKIDRITANESLRINNSYIWRPCKNFDIGTLRGVTFVQYSKNTGDYIDIGTNPNGKFNYFNRRLQYRITSKNKDRQTFVTLICANGTSKLKFLQEYPTRHYKFQLSSPYCCPVELEPSGGKSLSAGSILTILFFTALFLYIVIGVCYQVIVRQAEGLDRIPNKAFWLALPGLIEDGYKFTLSCFKSRKPIYNEI